MHQSIRRATRKARGTATRTRSHIKGARDTVPNLRTLVAAWAPREQRISSLSPQRSLCAPRRPHSSARPRLIHDPVLLHRLLDVPGQEQLLQLARGGLLPVQEHVLHELHGDRRRAVLEVARLQVLDDRRPELAHDEAAVLVLCHPVHPGAHRRVLRRPVGGPSGGVRRATHRIQPARRRLTGRAGLARRDRL